ncbi:MAG: 2-phospho-L-lactate guanylyltransferase [Nocardioidaceae bacterium]|nr:2-phospho-L-lactate guanylyltransferase [Nocardioidaceae bacterium]
MPETTPAEDRRYAVLVPVKPPAFAKSRLAPVGDAARVELATAFAADTVTAALGCPVVERVLVVTDDHVLAGWMRDLGADVLPDATTDDLNATLVQAAAEMHRRDPSLALVGLCADLPALRTDELAEALSAADPERMSFVADRDGVGTTAVVAPTLTEFRPAFGPGSRQRHLDEGAVEITAEVPTVRRDVDDPDELAEAVALGVGPRTSLVTTMLRAAPEDLG